MAKFVFIFSFIFVCSFLGFRLENSKITDAGLWSDQARYVQTGDSKQFDFLGAYGHPGGTVIEGTIAIHKIFGISYKNSLFILISVLGGLFAAGSAVICFLLTKNNFLWLAVLGMVSLNVVHDYSSPPSLLVSLSVVFLCLLTAYLCRDGNQPRLLPLTFWGLLAGFSIATRTDIGGIMSLSFLVPLKQKISWRRMFIVLGTAMLAFILFDPFMWFMPLKHIGDLVYKMVLHYAEFAPTSLKSLEVVSFSLVAFISMSLASVFVFYREKIKSPVTPYFFAVLLLITAVLYNIFLTAQYQTQRYFEPIILVWETLLPFFVFTLGSRIRLNIFQNWKNRFITAEAANSFVLVALVLILYCLVLLWSNLLHDLSFYV